MVLLAGLAFASPAMAEKFETAQFQTLEGAAPATAVEEPQEPTPQDIAPYRWTIYATDAGLTVTGDAPAEAFRRFLPVRAQAEVADESTIRPGAPEGFIADALAAVEAMGRFEQGQAGRDANGWYIAGLLAPGVGQDAVEASLAGAFTAIGDWRISVIAPVTPQEAAAPELADMVAEETPEPLIGTSPDAPPAEDACREAVASYMAERAILFPSAGTVPTPASLDLLPDLADRLAICPDQPIYVEGHTDADGGADANLTLSIRRAEAVVDALVDLGVDPARLYAVGYGASLPVAPNTSAEGKRQNRRIVFSFEDIAIPTP